MEFFTAEEETSYGLHGIKLKPVDEAKRTWLFRADNEDEQNQWTEVCMFDLANIFDFLLLFLLLLVPLLWYVCRCL